MPRPSARRWLVLRDIDIPLRANVVRACRAGETLTALTRAAATYGERAGALSEIRGAAPVQPRNLPEGPGTSQGM